MANNFINFDINKNLKKNLIDIVKTSITDKDIIKILEASKSTQIEIIQEAYKILKNTATTFEEKYNKMQKNIRYFETQLKNRIKSWERLKRACGGKEFVPEKDREKYLNDRFQLRTAPFFGFNNLKQEILQTFQYGLKFQAQINAVLGQYIATVYTHVNAEGKPSTYIKTDLSNFLYVDTDRAGKVQIRFKDSITQLQNQIESIESLFQKQTLNTLNFKYNILNQTYNEIYIRYQKYKKSGQSWIFWLNPNYSSGHDQKWHGAYIQSFGSINEAYGSILLHQKYNPRNIKEDNIEQFMKNVLEDVTNLSGALSGDTNISIENEKIEIALKSTGSSVLGIAQLIDIANDIILNQEYNNFEKIKLALINYQLKQAQKLLNKNLNDDLVNCLADSMDEVYEYIKNLTN